jgi:myo-inositol-1(or 4)-monophosphatase
MSVAMPRLLAVVEEAAALAKKAFDEGSYAVREKARGDWASTADTQVEAFLKAELSILAPNAQFLGEETGLSQSVAPASASKQSTRLTWVVDPIDGTANFVRGIPHFCSVVALVNQQMEPILGVIVDPCRKESFWVVKGEGAWLNHRLLPVSIDRHPLESLLAVVTPKPTSPVAHALQEWLPKAVQSFGGLRRSGAMALDLAWLAAGRMDAFVGFNLDPWDVLAGSLLVTEVKGHYSNSLLSKASNGPTEGRPVRRIAAAGGRQCLEAALALDPFVGKSVNS